MSVMTLRNVENGGMGVTIGAYAAVLHVLGLDGDLDAVASDGSLHLIVWENDGTGRLTRQSPKQSLPAGLLSGHPTVDRDPAASTTFAQPNRSSVATTVPLAGLAPREAPWRLSPTSSRVRRLIAWSRIPRAPPASVLVP